VRPTPAARRRQSDPAPHALHRGDGVKPVRARHVQRRGPAGTTPGTLRARRTWLPGRDHDRL